MSLMPTEFRLTRCPDQPGGTGGTGGAFGQPGDAPRDPAKTGGEPGLHGEPAAAPIDPPTAPDANPAAAKFGTSPAPGTASAAAPSRLGPRDLKPDQTLIESAISDTVRQPGARVALIWISIVALLAIFFPFLANSRPFVANWADGTRTFPLFNALTWVDYTLLIGFFAAIPLLVLSKRKVLRFRAAFAIFSAVLLVGAVAGSLFADPPKIETYERFREAKASGELTSAVYAPIPFSPNDANRDDTDRTRPQQPPSSRHWLGTTVYGEDLASRMISATRIALAIGFIATGISTTIGVIIGAIMGYFAGFADLMLMRFVEVVEAVPRIVLLMIVVTFFGAGVIEVFGQSIELRPFKLVLMMITIGLVSWTGDARFIRAEFLKLRKQDFVQACVAMGLPLRSLLFRHMLPNGVAPVLVNVSFGIAGAILLESVLSFLGLGLEADQASWGQLLDQARQGGSGFNWWIATFPGLAIFLTVFAYILIGEAMRDAIDPKLKKAD